MQAIAALDVSIGTVTASTSPASIQAWLAMHAPTSGTAVAASSCDSDRETPSHPASQTEVCTPPLQAWHPQTPPPQSCQEAKQAGLSDDDSAAGAADDGFGWFESKVSAEESLRSSAPGGPSQSDEHTVTPHPNVAVRGHAAPPCSAVLDHAEATGGATAGGTQILPQDGAQHAPAAAAVTAPVSYQAEGARHVLQDDALREFVAAAMALADEESDAVMGLLVSAVLLALQQGTCMQGTVQGDCMGSGRMEGGWGPLSCGQISQPVRPCATPGAQVADVLDGLHAVAVTGMLILLACVRITLRMGCRAHGESLHLSSATHAL